MRSNSQFSALGGPSEHKWNLTMYVTGIGHNPFGHDTRNTECIYWSFAESPRTSDRGRLLYPVCPQNGPTEKYAWLNVAPLNFIP